MAGRVPAGGKGSGGKGAAGGGVERAGGVSPGGHFARWAFAHWGSGVPDGRPPPCFGICGSWRRRMLWFLDVSALTQQGDTLLPVATSHVPGSLGAEIQVFGDTQVTLTQTPQPFRPEDARDETATSGCSGNPGDNCRPLFTVHWAAPGGSSDCSDFAVTYDFTLDHPSQIAGQPVTAWLKGTSSNGGTDDVNFPDYIFGPQTDSQLLAADQGGLHLATVSPLDTSQDVQVVVKSRDYGGSAVLRPKATIKGSCVVGGKATVAFNVIDESSEDVKPPACADAADFAKHPFASLPVDQDCNGIADDWEKNHGGPFRTTCRRPPQPALNRSA